MREEIFRKSSLERLNSPAKLSGYIRVVSPQVWFVLFALLLLLAGTLIWGVFGTIESTVSTGARVSGEVALCPLSDEDAQRLTPGMTIEIAGQEGIIRAVSKEASHHDLEPYLLQLSGLDPEEDCRMVEAEVEGLQDGIYPASLVVESFRPISFVVG